MIDTPRIVHTEAEHYAFIPLQIPRSEIHAMLRPTLQELHDAVSAQGLPIKPWFAHHLTLSDGNFDFETCLPVDDSFAATGRVQLGLWTAAAVARTIYHGDYPGLPGAWQELNNWLKQAAHPYATHIYERYVGNQGNTKDPADYRTELSWPLIAKLSEEEPS